MRTGIWVGLLLSYERGMLPEEDERAIRGRKAFASNRREGFT
jgi:hypothetical protein